MPDGPTVAGGDAAAAPDRFELPRANEKDNLSWLGSVLVANFDGITGSSVREPPIKVNIPRTPIRQGDVRYPYDSFQILIEQRSAVLAIVDQLSALGTLIEGAVGSGVAGVARQIQTRMLQLLQGRQFLVKVSSTVVVQRKEPEEGTNDVFLSAVAGTLADVSSAGDGLKFRLTTKLDAERAAHKPLPPNGPDPTVAETPAPPAAPAGAGGAPPAGGGLQTVQLAARDDIVFRMRPGSTKSVELVVEALATVDAILTGDALSELIDKVKSLLEDNGLAKDGKIDKEASTYERVRRFLKDLASFVLTSLTPRVASFVVRRTTLEFALVPEKNVQTLYGVDPNMLALREPTLPADGELAEKPPPEELPEPEPATTLITAVVADDDGGASGESGTWLIRSPGATEALERTNGGGAPSLLIVEKATGRTLKELVRVAGRSDPAALTPEYLVGALSSEIDLSEVELRPVGAAAELAGRAD